MTQIIGLLTPTCVYLAGDRLLTWNEGRNNKDNVRVFKDNECKIVALGAYGGFGYTGLARLNDFKTPMHEWLAVELAKGHCGRFLHAAQLLPEKLKAAIAPIQHVPLRGITLMGAAWDWFGTPVSLLPCLLIITNQYDENGNQLPFDEPTADFRVFWRVLQQPEPLMLLAVGHPIPRKREISLHRSLRRALHHDVGPQRILKYLVEEIQHGSEDKKRVGEEVLAMCVPKISVESWLKTGDHLMMAAPAGRKLATFGFFNPDRRELIQFGPTYVFGGNAISDVEGITDAARDYQSISVKFLRMSN